VTKYELWRLTADGWALARTNLDTLIVAEALFRKMKAEDPKLKLRLLEVTETVMREE
jgi:hypothetical protein